MRSPSRLAHSCSRVYLRSLGTLAMGPLICRRSPFAGLRGSTVGESTRRSLFAVGAPSPGSGARRSANQHVVLFLPSEPLRRAPGLDGRRINTSFSFCRRGPFAGLRGSTVGEYQHVVLFLPSEPLRRAPGLDGRRINTSFSFSLGRDETVSSRRARASPGRGSRHRSRYRSRLARAAHTRARW